MNEATVLAAFGAVLGFLAKSAWDLYWMRRQQRQALSFEKRVKFLERQLEEFFWPIYIRLQKDNAVWERLLDRGKSDPVLATLGRTIESAVLLPNHGEIVAIIQSRMHLTAGDTELEEHLVRYLRHVAVYQALRQAGVTERDPLQVGEPWPEKLFSAIKERTKRLQAEYDTLLKLGGAV